ncbi:hypothetical protein [Rhizobium sp. BK068]|uniref:hypothetical protein n=1 Tax=Rhizobium sp. BK068 TaxID=2512130 RepID=UPI001051238D|nr:hypothetical protein [Rhizobium sp. BK068]TCM62265.1 hypothetical protein EV291_15416 [Rhizobium sp. BK068]
MANTNCAPNPITREGLVSDLRELAEQAEASGQRWVALRALKLASHIELHGPANPVPASADKIIEIRETMVPLIRRFNPEGLIKFMAITSELHRCRLELLEAERDSATLH